MRKKILLTSKSKPHPRETVGFSSEFIIKYLTREGSSELSVFSLLFLARAIGVAEGVTSGPTLFLGAD